MSLPLLIVLFLIGLVGIPLTLLAIRRQKKPDQIIRRQIKKSKFRNWENEISAMAKFETADYESPVFLNQHNAFGMKHASKRKNQLGVNDGRQHRTYLGRNAVRDSTADLIDLLTWNRFPTKNTGLTDFVNNLKNDGYYTISRANYFKGLNSFFMDRLMSDPFFIGPPPDPGPPPPPLKFL